jgi:hypothetical protein
VINLKLLLRLLITFLPVFYFQHTSAQVPVRLRSVLSAGGSSDIVMSDGHQYYLQQSIGQPGITGLSQNKNYQLRQGFIQPLAVSLKINSTGTLQATIFPNPASDNIIISLAEEITEPLYIALYDLNGKIIYFKKHAGSPELTMNAGDLAPGAYFIRVSTTTKYFYSRIIKL